MASDTTSNSGSAAQFIPPKSAAVWLMDLVRFRRQQYTKPPMIQARAFLSGEGVSIQKGMIKLVSPDNQTEVDEEWNRAAHWLSSVAADCVDSPLVLEVFIGGTDDNPMSGAIMSDPMQVGNMYIGAEIKRGAVRFMQVGPVEEIDGENQIQAFNIPNRILEAALKINVSPYYLTTSGDPEELSQRMKEAHEIYMERGDSGLLELIMADEGKQIMSEIDKIIAKSKQEFKEGEPHGLVECDENPAGTRSVLGIDIGSGRWACVKIVLDSKGEIQQLGFFPEAIGELDTQEYSLLVIDCPVGLLEDEDAAPTPKGVSGDRPVDKGARKWVGSSVFPAPTRGQLARSLELIRQGVKAPSGEQLPGGLSRQGFSLAPYINDADMLKRKHPEKVFESHPEVAFLVAEGRKARFESRKKSVEGQKTRAEAINNCLAVDSLVLAREAKSRYGIPVHDWLDAMMMAVVALDWLDADSRVALSGQEGQVEPWNGRLDQIMAMPWARK